MTKEMARELFQVCIEVGIDDAHDASTLAGRSGLCHWAHAQRAEHAGAEYADAGDELGVAECADLAERSLVEHRAMLAELNAS